ncbi:PH-like domain-containing protein [Microbacterium xanthum]|uniref:PH-like domain-containing protein n=1 Tax=Microbacterium xanthum TaxID=3079794 RepID=UPI002AD460E2|nr:hypothetical protein [Microbacterium sp. KSW-48]MDZ8172731.1 hypothetical protein [Microbacterium sp. KSW-48]
MSREAALMVVMAVAVALLVLAAIGWWRRSRRDRGLVPPVGRIPEGALERDRFRVLYVATTRADEPLERLAIRGMGFRAAAELIITERGVALHLAGEQPLFFSRPRLVAVDQSTVAIDRVVERDGLVRLIWRISDDTVVDTYLRPQDSSARALADALGAFITPTGADA